MITIAVCDDDRLFAAKLKEKIRYLCACRLPERIECHVEEEFCSGSDVLVYLENHPINILFLDIDMPEMSGFTIAEQLNRKYPDTLLLFVSAHEQFVYSSFEYSPFRFLRKSHLESRRILYPNERNAAVLHHRWGHLAPCKRHIVFRRTAELLPDPYGFHSLSVPRNDGAG